MSEALKPMQLFVNKDDSKKSILSNLAHDLDGLGRIDRIDLTSCSLSETEEAELLKLLIRLFKKIYRKRGDHWFWRGKPNVQGYGRITVGKKIWQAHRLLYELFRKPIPDGMELHHRCGLESCVRPDHLMPIPPGLNKRLRDFVADPAKLAKLREAAKKSPDFIGLVPLWVEGQRKSAPTKKTPPIETPGPAEPATTTESIKAKMKNQETVEIGIPTAEPVWVKKMVDNLYNPDRKRVGFWVSWLNSPKQSELYERAIQAGIAEENHPHIRWRRLLVYNPADEEQVTAITDLILAWRRRQREIHEKELERPKKNQGTTV